MPYDIRGPLLILALAGIAFASQAQDSHRGRRALQEAIANPSDSAKVDTFVSGLVETPPGSDRYVVEGDIVLSREEINSYLQDLKSPTAAPVKSGELIVNVVGGQMDYLVTPERRKLTYAFEPNSFPTAQNFEFTKANFRKAADEWIAACPECGISFTEVEAGQAYFKIRYEELSDGTIARSFFPSSPPSDRALVVFTPYLSPELGFNPVGVLRHELGHILGYRHEHIRDVPGCYREGMSWKPITPYTPNSVMHYFCGGGGSFDLTLREEDKRGHRCLYLTGRPCPTAR